MEIQRIMRFLKKDFLYNFLFLSIILVTGIKLFLMGNGFLAFPDEWRHIASGHVLKYIQAGDFESAIQTIFSTQGRPVDTIIKIIPNGMQYISAQIFGLEYYESDNSYPLFLFNFFIYCLLLLVHFKVSCLFFKEKIWCLFSVLVFSCLANSYIYLRHALPYDCSLLILYYIFYKVLKITNEENFTLKKIYFLGFFAFIGYLSYPGYFLFYALLGLFFFFNNLDKNEIISRIKWSVVYLFGSLTCFAIFEFISRSVGTSYVESSKELSGTLNQGSFEECFSFLFKYLFQVEKITGILLILGLAFFTFLLFKTITSKNKINSLQIVFIITFFVFLVFAGAGFFLQKVILSGRVLHQFLPLLCLFLIYGLRQILIKKEKYQFLLIVISSIIICNFTIQFIDYQSYSYPKDVSWHYFKKYYPKEINSVCEINQNAWDIFPIVQEIKDKFSNKLTGNQIVIINACNIYPFPGRENHSEFKPNKNQVLLYSKSSYLNFEGYKFEGYSIEDRKNIKLADLQTKVYLEK